MENKELFLPYEESLALKELGFDEPCLAYYDTKKKTSEVNVWQSFYDSSKCRNSLLDYVTTAPLYDQMIDWLEKIHGISLSITPTWSAKHWNITGYSIKPESRELMIKFHEETFAVDEYEDFKTRKEALLAGIKKCIELLKAKK